MGRPSLPAGRFRRHVARLDEAVAAGCQATVADRWPGGADASGFYEQAERSAEALLATGNPQSLRPGG